MNVHFDFFVFSGNSLFQEIGVTFQKGQGFLAALFFGSFNPPLPGRTKYNPYSH